MDGPFVGLFEVKVIDRNQVVLLVENGQELAGSEEVIGLVY